MQVLVLRVGVPETGGAASAYASVRPGNGFKRVVKKHRIALVGVATITISEVKLGSISEIIKGDMEVNAVEMAITRSSDQEISSSIFLEICWQGLQGWAKEKRVSDGWYAVKVVGVFATDKEGYYGGKAKVDVANFPILCEGGKISVAGVPEQPKEN